MTASRSSRSCSPAKTDPYALAFRRGLNCPGRRHAAPSQQIKIKIKIKEIIMQEQQVQIQDPFEGAEYSVHLIGGVEWRLYKFTYETGLSYHSSHDGGNVQMREILKTEDGFQWEFAWLIHADKDDKESPRFYARRSGQEKTLEEAAAAVLTMAVGSMGSTWSITTRI
jgi:hypothetical protein